MKKLKGILISIVLCVVLIWIGIPTELRGDEGGTDTSSVGYISQEEIDSITNLTIRDFALYCRDTGTSPADLFFWAEYLPKDETPFVVIGEYEKGPMPPPLGMSLPGYEGVVTVSNGIAYDTTDKNQATTYEELKEALFYFYEH